MNALLALAFLVAAPPQLTLDPDRARPGETTTVTFRVASARDMALLARVTPRAPRII